MRLNYIVQSGMTISMNDIQMACSNFFHQHKTIPDTVKMSYHDHIGFLSQMAYRVETLERGKDYGLFLPIPGGMVELMVLEQTDESTLSMTGSSMIIVESTRVDREFEKHVLNEGK